jgi:hypothetical protein
LIPSITITAQNPSGKVTEATLSSNMTTFVNGVFSGTGTPITSSALASATALANSNIKFTVPGQKLAIFPIGLIVTVVWTILFIANLAWGTYGRFQFREQYRRRMLRGNTTKTI